LWGGILSFVMAYADTGAQPEPLPVAIVGGGPVGLALAIELGRYNVSCVLIEQTDGEIDIDNAKFVDINMRSMEFCRRWGIAAEIRDRGFNRDYPQDTIQVTSLTGYLLARRRFPSFAQLRTPPTVAERIARCPQTIFDPILKRTAATFPSVRFRYRTRCEEVRQDEDGATLTLTNRATGASETLRACYVACCEGAGSAIREALGIEFEGRGLHSYGAHVVFRSTELLRIHDKGPGFYTAIGPEGRWASVLAIDGRSLWRLQISSIDRSTFDRAEAARLVRRFAGTDFPFEIVTSPVFTRREVVAQSFQAGRIFLLGDSAHQLPPAGGFGLNTGIGDATNLAWKIAATRAGWGGPGLLASYEPERKPVAERNVRASSGRWEENRARTSVPGPAILEAGPEGDRVRAEVGQKLQDVLDRTSGGYEYGARYEDAGLQLGYRYEGSPIIVPDGTPPPPDDVRVYTNVAWPGSRAPHYWLDKETSILDLFGEGFVLLRLRDDAPLGDAFERAAAACGLPLSVHSFDVPQLFHIYNKRLVLVRPDGHVAWRGDDLPAESQTIIDIARGAVPVREQTPA
jgi:2-polyprenyl-6-methoxyphenol hydroxylase-like FAD-dependent oxidoreductase